jgi:pentatricopeptide repeat protein
MDGVDKCWKIAVNELDIAPNEGVCMSVLNAAARHGFPDLATDVLRVLKHSGVPWKEYHFAALIEAFCHDNKLKQALITLYIMRSNGIPPLPGTLIVIRESIKDVESLDSAIAIIDEIHNAKVGLDIDALKLIIQAAVFLRDLQRAVGVYKSYPDYGWKPDVTVYNVLLDGCIAAKHRQLGDELLADMKKLKIEANEETYEKIIQLCLTQEVYEDAFFYLEEMKAASFVPPRTVYKALVLKCHSEGDTRMDIALAEMRECGYLIPRLPKPQSINEPELTSQSREEQPEGMTLGLDVEALEYIKTGGLSRKRS